MSFNGLQFQRAGVNNARNIINQQHRLTSSLVEAFRKLETTVTEGWIGGDADAFAQDVETTLIPAIAALIATIAGMNSNLRQATDLVDQADYKSWGIVSQLADTF